MCYSPFPAFRHDINLVAVANPYPRVASLSDPLDLSNAQMVTISVPFPVFGYICTLYTFHFYFYVFFFKTKPVISCVHHLFSEVLKPKPPWSFFGQYYCSGLNLHIFLFGRTAMQTFYTKKKTLQQNDRVSHTNKITPTIGFFLCVGFASASLQVSVRIIILLQLLPILMGDIYKDIKWKWTSSNGWFTLAFED